jgi:hypothetical protein
MSLKQWEKKVLQVPGVDKRVRESKTSSGSSNTSRH